MDSEILDLATGYALDHWCVPCSGRPEGEAGDGTLVLNTEITDANFKALYQLWYLWAKEDGRQLVDEIWARHFAGLVLASAAIPHIVYDGTLPVATAFMVLQHDPWDGQLVAYGDHAYTIPEYRKTGALYTILEGCHHAARRHGADKIVMPIAAKFDWEKYKPWYEAVCPGWDVYSRILINHLEN